MELGRGGQGGEPETGFGGVLQVGAGVGEEDEGHGCAEVERGVGWGGGANEV